MVKIKNNWNEFFVNEIYKSRDEESINDKKIPLYSLLIKEGIVQKTERYERGFLVKNDNKKYKVVYPGDLVFNPPNLRFGAISILKTDFKVLVSPSYEVFYTDQKKFCSYYLGSLFSSEFLMKKYLRLVEGTLIERTALKLDDFFDLKLRIPSLDEQKKISFILKHIDKIISENKSKVEKIKYLNKSLLKKFLNKGIKNNKFKNTKLGKIPDTWDIKSLDEIGNLSKGLGISKKDTTKSGYPCLRYAEIYTRHNNIIKSFYSFIPKTLISKTKVLKKNDIIFACSGENIDEIGKSVLFTGDHKAYVGGDTMILSLKTNINSRFLIYQLNDDERRKQLRKLGTGSSIFHIYKSDLKELLILVPPEEEQIKIANILGKFENFVDKLEEKILKYEILKQSLLSDLLTGKIKLILN